MVITKDELDMVSKLGEDKDVVDYWVDVIQEDLGTFSDSSEVAFSVKQLRDSGLLKYFTIDETGIFAYIVTNDFLGSKSLSELMFYIRPHHRGDLRLVKRYIKRVEQIALDNCCKCVKIGANIKYKDQSFIKLLKRWGYQDDTVSKHV